MTKVRLTSSSKENFDFLFERFCNTLSVAAQKGIISNDNDRNDPGASGRHWWMPKENKIDFYPASNDFWGFIQERTETSATIDVIGRYDGCQKILKAAVNLFDVICHNYGSSSFEILE